MSVTPLFQVSPVSGVPIYRQLIDQVHSLVASGRLEPNARLPTVRELAESLQINPMTVSKAYSLLERDGIVEHVRGHGMFVRSSTPTATVRERLQALEPVARSLITHAYQLALSRQQVQALLDPLLKELEQNPNAESAENEVAHE